MNPSGMNGNASPLASPVSPGFFIPLPIPERAESSQMVGSSSSVPLVGGNVGVAAEHNTGTRVLKQSRDEHVTSTSVPSPKSSTTIYEGDISMLTSSTVGKDTYTNGDANEKDGAPPSSAPGSPNPDDPANNPRLTVTSNPAGTNTDFASATTQTRARSTSISSSRSHLPTYTNLHIPHSGYTSVTSGTAAVGVGGHRRERSGTVSSVHHHHHHHQNAVATGSEDGEGGRQRQLPLNVYAEETMQAGEEVPYVDQQILRNRLVRCFVTFATVETEEGRGKQQQQQQRKGKASPSGRSRLCVDSGSTVATRGPTSDTAMTGSKEMHAIANALFPFYISPIHIRSTHPTFSGLSPRSDYASWLSVKDSAAHTLVVDVWVELEVPARRSEGKGSKAVSEVGEGERRSGGGFVMTWHKLKGVGGIVDLRRLHEVDETVRSILLHSWLR